MRGTWQTTGGGGSGGGLVLIVIVAALAIGSGAASAAVSALVTIVIVIGCVIGLAVLGGIAWLVWRARSDRPGRPVTAPVVSRIESATPPELSETYKLAIEPPRGEQHLHLHLDGADPQVIAAIMRQLSRE